MVQAYENQQRIRMNIQIQAPIILVPVASDSREAIAVDLGSLAIRNVISEIASSKVIESCKCCLIEIYF